MNRIIFTQVPELGRSNVRVKDPVHVENALKTMMKDAQHKLQVIADFDWTLSKCTEDGKTCSTTHSVLGESKHMPEYYRTETRRLKDIYMPIEFDPTKTVEEKIPKMIEWYSKNHELLVTCHLTKQLITTMVRESRARLRDGCKEFFDQLHNMEIPLLLFSAGMGDIIKETIQQQATFYPENMKIVANFFKFDDTDKMVGFSGDLIHTFNKNENSVHSGDYFSNIRHRENLLLMGDSLGDLGMAKGADNVQCSLKIGFLNFQVDKNLDLYMQNFDIVIIEDESLDVLNGLVRAILGH
ncbi:5'-nucleotidase [Elysia marginata]|uniref:5'-nucleotidase n=1 Tax=Elysia marginata TaxID=1093978 RepID=A0AAV4EQ15_9GAST|nr:5'-nucleotidase [Elysia marginata]